MARPKKEINWEKLDSYLQCKSSKSMCAALIGVSEDTIERRIKEEHDVSFAEYAQQKLAPVKAKLVQTAMSKAFSGDNVMIIFCLKNLCGWKDNPDAPSEPITGMEF